MKHPRSLIYADALIDDRGVLASPGAILVRWTDSWPGVEALAVGAVEAVRRHEAAQGARCDNFKGSVVLPALVNAHTHLDLTAVGPQPFDEQAGFSGWIGRIRDARPTADADIARSVRAGVELSLAGGVVAVGDIAGAWSVAPIGALRTSPLMGVSLLECFGLGRAAEVAADRLTDAVGSIPHSGAGVRLGLQPHATYSAGRRLYKRAGDLAREFDLPCSTHLAESMDERRCVVDKAGPIRAFLESLGLSGADVEEEFGKARSPVAHLARVLTPAPWLVAHVNDCDDDDLDLLADLGAVVVYCPRASAYFQHEKDLGPHRYADMLARGITVALGTDSIVCLPADQADRLSTLDEMRFLWRRDRTSPLTLLGMATTGAAKALGLAADLFRLTTGPIAGLIAIPSRATGGNDPLQDVLESDLRPTLLSRQSRTNSGSAS